MSRKERAEAYFRMGYNCSQAVVMSFCEEMGISEEVAAKISICYGGGTGRMRLTCGALNSAFTVVGAMYSTSDGNAKNKAEMYALIQDMAQRFKERQGSINCGELLTGRGIDVNTHSTPEERTEAYYKKRPCISCILDAVEILEEIIEERK